MHMQSNLKHCLTNYGSVWRESLSVIGATHCINKAILYQKMNDAEHVSGGEIKTYWWIGFTEIGKRM